jgi:hypothetical protein
MGYVGLRRFVPARQRAALVVVLTALVLLLPASASGYLYWEGDNGIARADLDGNGMETNFIPKLKGINESGVAVSSRYIYFGGVQGLIGRANLNGGDVDPDLFRIPQPVPGLYEPVEVDAISLVVAGTHIYWTSWESSIGRASVDGGGIEPAFIKTEAQDNALAVDAGHIYWATEHAIGRANLDGGGVEPDFISLGAAAADGVAVADGHIYWTVFGGHSIGRSNIDGRGVDPNFIAGLDFVSDAAIGGSYIYWQAREHEFGLGRVWIGRANLNGGDVRKTLINVAQTKEGMLAADALGPGGEGMVKRL